jgi:hypothetical protein
MKKANARCKLEADFAEAAALELATASAVACGATQPQAVPAVVPGATPELAPGVATASAVAPAATPAATSLPTRRTRKRG